MIYIYITFRSKGGGGEKAENFLEAATSPSATVTTEVGCLVREGRSSLLGTQNSKLAETSAHHLGDEFRESRIDSKPSKRFFFFFFLSLLRGDGMATSLNQSALSF